MVTPSPSNGAREAHEVSNKRRYGCPTSGPSSHSRGAGRSASVLRSYRLNLHEAMLAKERPAVFCPAPPVVFRRRSRAVVLSSEGRFEGAGDGHFRWVCRTDRLMIWGRRPALQGPLRVQTGACGSPLTPRLASHTAGGPRFFTGRGASSPTLLPPSAPSTLSAASDTSTRSASAPAAPVRPLSAAVPPVFV